MSLFSLLFGRKKGPAKPVSPTSRRTESVYLTQTVVFGHGDSSVFFVDETRGIRKMLIDATGRIRHFPGIRKEPSWTKEVSEKDLLPRVRYRTSFEKRGHRWLMLWTVQPDGDYWRDEDGFGAEDQEEIVLYTYVDENGNFTGPFSIYGKENL